MPTNDILQFCNTDTGTNLLSEAEYTADAQRVIGNQPGIARSKLINKAIRQATLMAAALAQVIVNKTGQSVLDNNSLATIITNLTTAMTTTVPDASDTVKGIVELATNAEVAAGVDTSRAVTPAGAASVYTKGAASSTDNAVVRWDLATGKAIQNSVVTLGDTGIFDGILGLGIGATATNALVVNTGITQNTAGLNGTFHNGNTLAVGATSYHGFYSNFTVSSAVLSEANHFAAIANAISGAGTITTQRGFYVSSALTQATNNRAFEGALAAASNRYNLYMGGTAQNYLEGSLGLGVAVPTEKLDISGNVKVSGNDLIGGNSVVTGQVLVGTPTPAGAPAAGDINAKRFLLNGVPFTGASAGMQIGYALQIVTTNTALSTTMTNNDSVPANTQGTETHSLAYTPQYANSILEIEFKGVGGVSSGSTIMAAMFVDSVSAAINACDVNVGDASGPTNLSMTQIESAATTKTRTYKIRVGSTAGNARLNGNGSARLMGGVQQAVLIIREIKQ